MNDVTNTLHGGADVPNNEQAALWSLYIAGPDDLVAMPSKAVAEAVARNFNAVWDRYGAERDLKVHAVAHVEPWMHGRAAHTKDLREHFHEYADLVLDEDLARFRPAQPVEAVDGATDQQIIATCNAAGVRWIPEGEDDFPGMFDLTKMSEMRALFAALAHPRPTGDVLDAPALVGHTQFGKGIPWSTVIACAQRHYQHKDDPKPTPEQIAEFRNSLLNADAAPTGEQAGEVAAVAEVVSLRSDNYGHHHRIKWLDHYANAFPVGTKLYAQPRTVGVPDGEEAARTALTILGQRIAEAASSLPRPSWISTHKAEFWSAGIESLLGRFHAEVEMLDHELRRSRLERLAAAPAPGKGGEA